MRILSQNFADSSSPAPIPAQRFLLALQVQAEHEIGGPVPDQAVDAELDHQRVDPHDRIHHIERPGLPRPHVLEDLVGDRRDEVLDTSTP